MNFGYVKSLYVFSCVALSFIILSPTLTGAFTFPVAERFSEMWLLGSNHIAEDYPFNVSAGNSYRIYLGVGNHMGNLAYYSVHVKFRSVSDPPPNSKAGLPSPLEPFFEYNLFLREDEAWEREFSFAFEGVSFEGNVSRVSKVLVGGYAVDVNRVAAWNATDNAFYYELFFELWVYNATTSGFQFDNRWVGIWLNMSRQL